jgi:cysteine-rich repeat protein
MSLLKAFARAPWGGAAQKIEPARALVHPVWILSLGLLVLNDHFLKGSGLLPGWLTGKLSDLAGLIVAPVLLAAMVRARTRRAIVIVHAVVGLGYAGLEVSSSLTAVADSIYRLAGFSWHSTRDLTDLLALAVLPLAYLLTVRGSAGDWSRTRRSAVRLLGTAGLLACTASSGQLVEQPPPCGGPDCDADGSSVPEDCNDFDPNIGPGRGCPALAGEDVCDDGMDNDGDFLIDCDDDDCNLACADIDAVCSLAKELQLDEVALLQGSTLVGSSVTEGSCVGADSPEIIFRGYAKVGVLTLGVPAGHGIHVRADCPDEYTELACVAGDGAGGDLLEITVGAEQALSIVVEAIDPFQAGPFEVPVSFSPLDCGDAERGNTEECDDGNKASGDGCSAVCTAEPDVLCAAMPVVALGPTPDSFVDASSSFVGPCAGSLDQPERGYHYTAASTSVTLTVDSTADVALYATLGCGDTAAPLGCAEAVAGSGQETLTLVTQPGDEVTFFVELGAGGPEDATFTVNVAEP